MRICIIGTGKMAVGLGMGWARAGASIVFGSRDPDSRGDDVRQATGAQVMSHLDALDQADLVVLAIPYTAIESFARRYADRLRSKVVIDISNPFDNLPDNRIAGAEITTSAIGDGARVIAAFKDNFADTLLDPADSQTGLVRDVHYAGDDAEAKKHVARLIKDLGFRPVDCGPLKNARVLDVMVPLMLELDHRYAGGQAQSSWRFLT